MAHRNKNYLTLLFFIILFLIFLGITYFKTLPFKVKKEIAQNYKEFFLETQKEGRMLSEPLPEIEEKEIEGSFSYIVKFGDTLESLLLEQGYNNMDIRKVINLLNKKIKKMKIYAGQRLEIYYHTIIDYTQDNSLSADKLMPTFENKNQTNILEGIYFTNDEANIEVFRNKDGEFEMLVAPFKHLTKKKMLNVTIKNNLYQDAQEAGVSPGVIESIIRLYSFDIDFQRDIREGDSFQVFFEEVFDEESGKKLRDGKVFYSKLHLTKNLNKNFEYYLYKNEYYDSKGRTSQKSFLKTPVPGGRLTSRFGRRKHPILGFTRLHSGIDFGASAGTPIFAAAKGTIIFIGWNGTAKTGYGKLVQIKHNSTYSTGYAHMNGFKKGLIKGSIVQQGDIIGYVGSTGYATGPHLHYEVMKNGKKINPADATSFSAKALSNNDLKSFYKEKDRTLEDLYSFKKINETK